MTAKKPVQTFREGTIAASVWERAGRRGRYFELTVSRSFRRANEEAFGYSPCFRERDVEALKRCLDQAALWIRVQGPDTEGDQAISAGDHAITVDVPPQAAESSAGKEACEV
jgi:hypothetical protein